MRNDVNRISRTGINLSQGLVFIAKWHVTLPVQRHCIKIYIIIYSDSVCFCLQTQEMYLKVNVIY